MLLSEKQELVRLLNLYQVELLMANDNNFRFKRNTDPIIQYKWTTGVKAQYEHARIISSKLAKEIQEHILT